MQIWLTGWMARAALVVMAVVGFVLALGYVLDFYIVLWKYSVPLTLIYAALLWRFALAPAKGEPAPRPMWPLGLDIILIKLCMTIVLLLISLGVIALACDMTLLVADNWRWILLAFALLAVIGAVAVVTGRKSDKRRAPP